MKMVNVVLKAMDKGLVKSCHDCSDGGLAIAAAEMCISGSIGAMMDLSGMGSLPMERKLFSESNTRWLAEVSDKDADAFQKIFGDDAVCIGKTGGDRFVIKDVVDLKVSELRKAWSDPIWKIMGGASE
jgi:phosphoribosylformylglycinamidine synthase